MIATILPGSADFHAVGYNEHKVYKEVATLLEMQNFGGLDASEHPTAKQLVQFLQFYSSQNSRIQKPQFHVAISCKGHEMSEQQLLDFAHRYLQEMGYAEPGQPWLIYAHHDTDNTHLHIVTSRVSNASERYYIANEVVSRLEAINTDLFILAWQVRTLSWNDLWFSLDPEGWANVMSGKNIIGGIISDWNQGYSLKW